MPEKAQSPLVLVTGATDGIGLETALELARRGARVLVHGRSAAKLDEARARVQAVSQAPVPEPLRADFASLEEVRGLARELEARGERPAVLINNAGIFARKREKSRDGFELTFAVNHLAPFLLTHLVAGGPVGERLERVVNVSSMARRERRDRPRRSRRQPGTLRGLRSLRGLQARQRPLQRRAGAPAGSAADRLELAPPGRRLDQAVARGFRRRRARLARGRRGDVGLPRAGARGPRQDGPLLRPQP